MRSFAIIGSVVSFILLGAHFFRSGIIDLVVLALLLPLLLLLKKNWSSKVLSLFLLAGAFIWINTFAEILIFRIVSGDDYLRLILIMCFVVIFTLASAAMLREKKAYDNGMSSASMFSFFITFVALFAAKLKIAYPVLILERFIPGSAFAEIILLSAYAAWLTEKFLMSNDTAKLRKRIWIFFSVVFFTQFFLGLFINDIFLMTGDIHVPVPAVIAGGPVFRGEGFFMPILLAATIILSGPAWCSYLCYFGSWDGLASAKLGKPLITGTKIKNLRYFTLIIVVVFAAVMKYAGAKPLTAAYAGIIFGIIGVGIMIFISRKKGLMVHCTAYCPIGLIVNYTGKISPFRLKIAAECTGCGICSGVCKYGALASSDLQRGKPGLTCTLCGDCISSCKKGYLSYSFLNLSPENSRLVFTVIVVSLHSIFLGLAMV